MKTTFMADDPSAVSELTLLSSMIIGSDVCDLDIKEKWLRLVAK
jgi:hypothetical protein